MPAYSPLSDAQTKQVIDAEQAFAAWQDAYVKAADYQGGMHWKTVAGHTYLYKTQDRRGNAKSLGPKSAKTQEIADIFARKKAETTARLASLKDTMAVHARINSALRLGSAPKTVADVCGALERAGLMGKSIAVIGTNCLYAYEALAGVRFQRDIVATTDIDLLWNHKATVRLAHTEDAPAQGILSIIQRADKSFQRLDKQTFRAANDQGFMVDLIRQMPHPPWADEPDRFFEGDLVATDIWNMKWLLNAPRMTQTVIATHGLAFSMTVPDPRAYAMFKLWLSQSLERNPAKKSRDAAQAVAVAQLIEDRLPHLANRWGQLKSFPAAVRLQPVGDVGDTA